MIEELIPQFRFICDRCGKVIPSNSKETKYIPYIHKVEFAEHFFLKAGQHKSGEVCEECAKEFWEIVDRFFDKINVDESEDAE